jgi:hypothetical protein
MYALRYKTSLHVCPVLQNDLQNWIDKTGQCPKLNHPQRGSVDSVYIDFVSAQKTFIS